MGAVAAIGGLILGAGSAVSAAKQASNQKKAAAAADTQASQERQTLLTQQLQADAQAKANDTRAQQAGDLQRRRAAFGGRSSTLLTGGAGLTTPATTAPKTLLGQ